MSSSKFNSRREVGGVRVLNGVLILKVSRDAEDVSAYAALNVSALLKIASVNTYQVEV
jgi:hypothetical protein